MYLHVDLKIRYGSGERLAKVMAVSVPIMEELGWKLVGAYKTVIGDLNQVVDIWEVEDALAVTKAFERAASIPAFADAVAELREILVEERLQLMAKTDYSP